MSESETSSGDVCIVGLGAATAVGETALATAAAVRAGVAGFRDHTFMTDGQGEPMVVASAPYIDEFVLVEERLAKLAAMAVTEALTPLTDLQGQVRTVPFLVGLPEPRPGFTAQLEPQVVEWFRRVFQFGGIAEPEFNRGGHCGGFAAVQSAVEKLRSGATDFCLAGGVDSYIDPDTLEWIEDSEQLHNGINAFGFVPGEAAGFCLLCTEATAPRFELPVLGRIAKIATTREENCIKSEKVCTGRGLTDAFRLVLESLPNDLMMNDMICDQNGEPYRAEELGFTWIRTIRHFGEEMEFQSPADCWGDVGAASGPLFIALASMAAQKGYAKGPYNLLWTSSEAGHRTAAVFHAETNGKGPN